MVRIPVAAGHALAELDAANFFRGDRLQCGFAYRGGQTAYSAFARLVNPVEVHM